MPENNRIELKVSGMACAGCSGTVQKTLSKLEGVRSVKVDLAKKTAYVDYDPAKLTLQDLKNAVGRADPRLFKSFFASGIVVGHEP